MAKHRILLNSEWSASKSGYGRISKEVLTRLLATDKYELAELASYCRPHDPRIADTPWKVYPVQPDPNNQADINEYNAHPVNQCGRHKFNHAILDFQATTVFDARDFWYKEYEHISPFREYYNLIWVNPVDGTPQDPRWISDSIDADALMTYTDWGQDVLKRQCGGKGKLAGVFPLGVNFQDFYPIPNKKALKEHFGFKDDSLIVGFVARNQPRKLFSDLLEAFTLFLSAAPKNLANLTYLYFHTKWPDNGTDLPKLLMEYGVGHKVLFTYYCKSCNHTFPSTYSDTKCACQQCGQFTAEMPSPNDNINEEQLNLIYNFFDVYAQFSLAEGFGLPVAEAAACAVPTMAINYAGMVDFIDRMGTIPLKIAQFRREHELNRLFAIPDIQDFVVKLTEILQLPDSLRRKIGFEQYQKCLKEFNWDIGVKRLMDIIDEMPIKNWASKQNRLFKPQVPVPQNLTNEQYIHYLYHHVIGRPELFNRYEALRKIYGLTMEFTGAKHELKHYNREFALQDALGDNGWYNHWEQQRLEKFKLCH